MTQQTGEWKTPDVIFLTKGDKNWNEECVYRLVLTPASISKLFQKREEKDQTNTPAYRDPGSNSHTDADMFHAPGLFIFNRHL